MKAKILVCLVGTALLVGAMLSNQVNATSSGTVESRSQQAAATATALPKATGNADLLLRLYKDEKGRVIGGTVFPLLNYSPTMITGKPCPRVTKWTFEVVKMQPPLQDFGYVKDPCVVQNAVDDFVRTLYFHPAYQTPESMREVDKIYDTDSMNVKGVAEPLRKSMIKQYRDGKGIHHVCDKPLYLLLSVDARSPLAADPTGRVTGRRLRITTLKTTKHVEPFECKFVAYKDGSIVRTVTLTEADLQKGAKFVSFQYDLLWNPQTKTWMLESHDGFQLDTYLVSAKTLLAASPVKP